MHHRHPIVIIISIAHMVWSSRTSVSLSQWTSSIAWRGRDAPAGSRVFGFPKIPPESSPNTVTPPVLHEPFSTKRVVINLLIIN